MDTARSPRPRSGRRDVLSPTIVREIVREAFYGLYHHRFRAALSMLGISWGIVSVVVLLAYGDGFRGALDAGFRGRVLRRRRRRRCPGQTSLQAGGERAGKRVRVTVDDVAGDRRAAARQERQPGVHAGVPGRLRQQAVEPPDPRRRAPATARCAARRRSRAAGSSTTRTCGCAAASRSSAAKCSASCSAASRRSARRSASAASRSKSIGVMEEKVQLSNYNRPDKYCVFIPWTTMGGLSDTSYVGDVRLAGGVADARAEGRAAGARVPRQALPLQPDRRARARTCSARRRPQEITGGIVDGPEDRADVHRRADARHRRRRHHEHHVRERAGADARDRRAQGARRAAAARSCCSSCSKGWRRRSPAASSASRCRTGWSGCSARGRSSPSCSTTRSRVTDIHLVLSPQLVGDLLGDPDGRRPRQRPAAGDQGVAARSDRSAALRIGVRRPAQAGRLLSGYALQPLHDGRRDTAGLDRACRGSDVGYSSTSPVVAGTSR